MVYLLINELCSLHYDVFVALCHLAPRPYFKVIQFNFSSRFSRSNFKCVYICIVLLKTSFISWKVCKPLCTLGLEFLQFLCKMRKNLIMSPCKPSLVKCNTTVVECVFKSTTIFAQHTFVHLLRLSGVFSPLVQDFREKDKTPFGMLLQTLFQLTFLLPIATTL